LAAAGRELLLRAGLAAGRVETLAPCTRCYPDRYFSHRGGAGHDQRQLSWIGWRLDHGRP
ncbi:MAG: laccase domain-containing protein, partial [Deltaproteobacteria bacterium]